MEEVVSAMVIEESRLQMMSSSNPVKSAYTTMAERECFNCHLSYSCPLPKNYGGVVLVEVVVVDVAIKEVVVVAVEEVVQGSWQGPWWSSSQCCYLGEWFSGHYYYHR